MYWQIKGSYLTYGHIRPFSGGLEVMGANGGGGMKLGWKFIDRQTAIPKD
jgi:hypothetical protein